MIANDHVRFGRGPSGKRTSIAGTSPDGLPHGCKPSSPPTRRTRPSSTPPPPEPPSPRSPPS